jgi:hypothetical protein
MGSQILKSISPADEVLIIGPGLAKQELRRLIDDDPRMKKRLGAVQNAERMTQNQLIARVRQFFTLRSQAKRDSATSIVLIQQVVPAVIALPLAAQRFSRREV